MSSDPGTSIAAMLRALGRRLQLEKRRLKVGRRTISDAELAQRAGVSRSTVARLWQGEPIGTDNLIRVVRALGRLDLLHGVLGEAGPTPLERLGAAASTSRKRQTRKRQSSQRATAPDISVEPIPVAERESLRDKYGTGRSR